MQAYLRSIYELICYHLAPNKKEVRLFESGAILLYLAEKYKKFIPPVDEIEKRAEVNQWLFWLTGGVGPIFGNIDAMERMF
jgi:glutathione S-transferase